MKPLVPHAQGGSAADLAMAALQAALPTPEAPADARRSLLGRSCPLPGAQTPGAGPLAGVGLDGGCAPAPLLRGEQAAAEGGRAPRRAHPGLPQGHADLADKPSSSSFAKLGAFGAGHAVKRAASCELPCGFTGDRQEGLDLWAGSALAPAAPEGSPASPDWQRLHMAVELLASLGGSMPQSCEARARPAALLFYRPFLPDVHLAACLPAALPLACDKVGTAPVRSHILMDLIVQSRLACLMHGCLRPNRVPWWR